jgi:hypothetical protein
LHIYKVLFETRYHKPGIIGPIMSSSSTITRTEVKTTVISAYGHGDPDAEGEFLFPGLRLLASRHIYLPLLW